MKRLLCTQERSNNRSSETTILGSSLQEVLSQITAVVTSLRGLNWLQLIIIAENSVISICFSCVNVCRLLGLLSFNSMELLLHIRISQITHALW